MLQPQQIQTYLDRISHPDMPVADFLKRNIFMGGLWLLGIPALAYGAVDRGIVAFSQNPLEVTALSHCLLASTALFVWFMVGMSTSTLEPINNLDERISQSPANSNLPSTCIAQQKYRLPFPYRCQIYHLLNLKHLEDIHRFSLGNLKITKVSHYKRTQTGGVIRFKTVLDSPLNILRLWRDPSVEVELILHTPYQIELKVPAYRQKFIRVLFSVVPINENEHIFSVQMFSDLQWPRELLRAILTIAASLTLLEDLPYLSQLAKTNVGRSHSVPEDSVSGQGMQLYHRYMHLYGHHWEKSGMRSLPTT